MEDQLTFNEEDQERPSLEMYDLGRIDYAAALELQRHYHRRVIEGTQSDVLLGCTHDPVVTCGTSTLEEHFHKPPAELESQGSPVVRVERGGSVTYHGPEQAILYPIINLHHHRTDVGWYMRSLEEVVIRTLALYDVHGVRVSGKTGVWINDSTKIAFCGVRISRWCTLHGMSLNVTPCAERFKVINPCGLGDIGIASLQELTDKPVTVQEVCSQLMSQFLEVFSYTVSI